MYYKKLQVSLFKPIRNFSEQYVGNPRGCVQNAVPGQIQNVQRRVVGSRTEKEKTLQWRQIKF